MSASKPSRQKGDDERSFDGIKKGRLGSGKLKRTDKRRVLGDTRRTVGDGDDDHSRKKGSQAGKATSGSYSMVEALNEEAFIETQDTPDLEDLQPS